jgi:alanine racemase
MFPERPLWIEIDLDALQHNFDTLTSQLEPNVAVIPALKGNAYGHGVGLIAEALSRQDLRPDLRADLRGEPRALAVGNIADARTVRSVAETPVRGTHTRWLRHPARRELHSYHRQSGGRAGVSAYTGNGSGPHEVFVEVDSGPGRLGAPLEQACGFIDEVSTLPNLAATGVYTHLTFHDAGGRGWARARLHQFDELLADLRNRHPRIETTQALASTGLLTGLTSRANAAPAVRSMASVPWIPNCVTFPCIDPCSSR